MARIGADCRVAAAALSMVLPCVAALADPVNVAHRGGTTDAPENTLPTYENSIFFGGGWVEIDVWNSLDGIPVCFHDATLDRTTDGAGLVYEKTLAELKELDAGSWFGPEFARTRIPTLEEALELIKGNGTVVLDIKKSSYIPAIANVVQTTGFPQSDLFAWIRYGSGMATAYKQALPGSEVVFGTLGPLFFEEEQIWSRAVADLPQPDIGLVGPWPAIGQHPRWVDLVHSYGLLCYAAIIFFGNDLSEAIASGVDAMVVSNPVGLEEQLPGLSRACSDGVDNDNDGRTDYPDDPGCFHGQDADEAAACSDGVDNDSDGRTDYPDDPGCFAPFYEFEAPACSDGADNNFDGETDYPSDPGCFALFDQREGFPCNDRLDNDMDGLIDFPIDPGCGSPESLSETGPSGAVPTGSADQLRVGKPEPGLLSFEWGASCTADDDDYAFYEGKVGDFTSHLPTRCTTNGELTYDQYIPNTGSRYFLVVPKNLLNEGSYGLDSIGAERPASSAPCMAQALGGCD